MRSDRPDNFEAKRIPTVCERIIGRGRSQRMCLEKAIGASFDCNGEYGIGYCARHEPLVEAIARVRREHPTFTRVYLDMGWVDVVWHAMALPFVAMWKRARR